MDLKSQIKNLKEQNLSHRKIGNILNISKSKVERILNPKAIFRDYKTNKIYRSLNKDKIRILSATYFQNNKHILIPQNNKRTRERKKIDPIFKMRCVQAKRINQALKTFRKSDKTLNLIGCTAKQLKEHLEIQFLEGMNWDNHGAWHVDHIRPCASFNLADPEEQKICFHYTNLQPLWAKDNLQKSDKYIPKILEHV